MCSHFSGVPLAANNGRLNDTAIVANAAETKPIAVGTTYYLGDKLTIDGYSQNPVYVLLSDQSEYATEDYDGWWKLTTDSVAYYSELNQYYISFSDDDDFTDGFWLTPAAGDTEHDPASIAGVKCAGGSGTEADPYTFELVYRIPEVGDVFLVGNPVYFGTDTVYINKDDEGGALNPVGINGTKALTYGIYDSNHSQYSFKFAYTEIWVSSDTVGTPCGLQIISGTGTKTDPFCFEPLFPPSFKVRDIINVGDTIDFGLGWYIFADDSPATVKKITGSMRLQYFGYVEILKQHSFYLNDDNSNTESIYFTTENKSTPSGIKVTSGTGTKADPFTFEPVFPEITRTPGDVDGNGKVEISDLTTLQKYLAGWSVTLK